MGKKTISIFRSANFLSFEKKKKIFSHLNCVTDGSEEDAIDINKRISHTPSHFLTYLLHRAKRLTINMLETETDGGGGEDSS